jgi:hypothetical protein
MAVIRGRVAHCCASELWAALNPNYSLLEGGARSPLPCGPSALAGLLLSHYGREGGEMGPAPL